MSGPRDSQRQKLYNAEREVSVWTYHAPERSIEECKAYIDKVLSYKVVQRHYPKAQRIMEKRGGILVKPGVKGRQRASGSSWECRVTLPAWARSELVMLHETAHALIGNQPWHGWEFAACYLLLVRTALGKEIHDELKAAFKKHRVRFTEKRTRTMTPEQRQAASDRMKLMHSAKVAASLAAMPAERFATVEGVGTFVLDTPTDWTERRFQWTEEVG